jgi:hypothetical protein
MNELNADYFRDLRRLLQQVAPGPWLSRIEGRDHASGSSFIQTGQGPARGEDIELSGASAADQDFSARAPGCAAPAG